MKRSTTLTTLALASALALTGCGTGAEETTGAAAETAAPATSIAEATATSTASPSGSSAAAEISAEHNAADVMFAQMMIPHHRQAVQMSEMLLAKDDIPADVRDFAQGVIAAQGPEIEQMQTMLQVWDEPTMMESGSMDHGSMGHGSGGHGMAGMMSQEDMAALEDAQGTEAVRLYLEQMIVHHRGAVEMAQEEVANGTNPQAVALAQQIIEAQEAEIQQMEQMLQELPSQS